MTRNPEIIPKTERYETKESRLSLTGRRKPPRWKSIKARYQNDQFQVRWKTFRGWTAQIMQHEIDRGILL